MPRVSSCDLRLAVTVTSPGVWPCSSPGAPPWGSPSVGEPLRGPGWVWGSLSLQCAPLGPRGVLGSVSHAPRGGPIFQLLGRVSL